MEGPLAVVVGILIATGVYLMLARDLLHYLFGLVLISNAANLAIFIAGRLTRASPPLIPEGQEAPQIVVANPLPQALILTAIVIGFGLLAFALALIAQVYRELGTLDVDRMRIAEPVRPKRKKSL
ncbi:Na+/H+ antiporter subunit C [Microbulbifer sp. OS29]|uniref:Na+/H+ antiporter subunit C n=1 Tax=Microbulbifer okhotskensis TaxID=2926617 RepID=A0A9X2ETU2_9GAMM|nr:Na+/H+ antiporter subunit C [Microbulbifer okhotskensis]MCO1335433.1 Na+/H+ antiporter subunit C [Microbulbifer okhotskensis]